MHSFKTCTLGTTLHRHCTATAPPLYVRHSSQALEYYYSHLHIKPRERRVVVCESLLWPDYMREAVATVLLEYLLVRQSQGFPADCCLLTLLTTLALARRACRCLAWSSFPCQRW